MVYPLPPSTILTSLTTPKVPTVYWNPVPPPYSGSKLTTIVPAAVGAMEISTVVASIIPVTVVPAIISPLPLTLTTCIPEIIPAEEGTVKYVIFELVILRSALPGIVGPADIVNCVALSTLATVTPPGI